MTVLEVDSQVSLLVHNQTEREREESSASLISSFERFLVFHLAATVRSQQSSEKCSKMQHRAVYPIPFRISISSNKSLVGPIQPLFWKMWWEAGTDKQEGTTKCLSGFPWHTKADWKTLE